MLGRLEMDVDSCIKWYIHLCELVFSNKMLSPIDIMTNIRARFDSNRLEEAIKKVIVQHGAAEDELLKKPENGCKCTYILTGSVCCTHVQIVSSAQPAVIRQPPSYSEAIIRSAAPRVFTIRQRYGKPLAQLPPPQPSSHRSASALPDVLLVMERQGRTIQ